jgi:polar amino acid transport system substrate-binding protein
VGDRDDDAARRTWQQAEDLGRTHRCNRVGDLVYRCDCGVHGGDNVGADDPAFQGTVQGVGDLSAVRVGVVNATSTQDALARRRISYRTFRTPRDAMVALRSRSIDAFVYDRPLLAWLVQQDFPSLEVLDMSFDFEYYAFAMPVGSPLRGTLNVTLLDTIQSAWWKQNLLLYLGEKEH